MHSVPLDWVSDPVQSVWLVPQTDSMVSGALPQDEVPDGVGQGSEGTAKANGEAPVGVREDCCVGDGGGGAEGVWLLSRHG